MRPKPRAMRWYFYQRVFGCAAIDMRSERRVSLKEKKTVKMRGLKVDRTNTVHGPPMLNVP
jgi:hypothetical protein